ncbi:hypothetical protein KW782_03235 [Candidatus Parcubacteria bacterium]|nr:hypothetical protein [Candidatus Parcubacteria bacterium]
MEQQSNNNLSFDASLLAFSLLKRLNAGKVDTFEERLRSQKVQYLAQVFSVSPAYKFNLYLRGPYSPGLANDLFKFNAERREPDLNEFIPSELEERFEKLKTFIEGKTTRQLELIVTLHWLLKVATLKTQDAIKRLKKWKTANDDEVSYSISQLKII